MEGKEAEVLDSSCVSPLSYSVLPFLTNTFCLILYHETKCIHNLSVYVICLLSLAHPDCSVLGKEEKGICVFQYVIALSTLTTETNGVSSINKNICGFLYCSLCAATDMICGVVLKLSRI